MDLLRKNKSVRYFLISFVLLVLSICFFSSCSYQSSRSVLSFFFDGVPDTTSQQKNHITITEVDSVIQEEKVIPAKEQEPKIVEYSHVPFKEGECNDCHNLSDGSDLLKPQPDLCYECHEDFSKKRYVHGPVAVGYCLTCHNAHKSTNQFLIIRKGQSLCTFCHTEKIEIAGDNHPIIGEEICWTCHSPHSSENQYLINDVTLAK